MGIKFKATVAASGTMVTSEQEFHGTSFVDFVAYLRGMFGKRIRARGDSSTMATYRNGGNYMTTVELQNGLAWETIADVLMDRFIESSNIRPVEIRTIDEVTPGGLWWAFDYRRSDLAPYTFSVLENGETIKQDICLDCAGAFEEWSSQRNWTLALTPVPGEYTCSMCLQNIGGKEE